MQNSKEKLCFEDSKKTEHNPFKCKQSQIRHVSVTKSFLERVIRISYTGFQFILKMDIRVFSQIGQKQPAKTTGVG